jgi:hypothetical protein
VDHTRRLSAWMAEGEAATNGERVMTTKTSKTEHAGRAVIARLVLVLDAAADRCLDLLVADPPPGLEESFALSDLGVGARLAADQARALLPPDVEPGRSSPNRDDPLVLVRAAEALTRTVPIEVLPAGGSHLVVALCDLLREHR